MHRTNMHQRSHDLKIFFFDPEIEVKKLLSAKLAVNGYIVHKIIQYFKVTCICGLPWQIKP